ncbi:MULTISPECIES: NAD(P)H-dependent oxidoreductase [unclassified Chitinophaga]|uniref:NAD(P)H-dependent oxidoreductase n=1 Tax=unclassified Chitinophaga TaxID=2619133 RepID=UPI0009C4E6AC|nr:MULTISPECIES: NAD(P)H-dependent oxidoreductase [unclassified Chitinophaga]OMP76122.1 NADPH quinone oxidoreductase [[Flexibacter] sp. ATCC 35208]WPV64237.1 NAD(P)H-dependent oxidoreductase [Chitinophaga sp. LS1]
MKILIVLAHPELQSMNGAMYHTAIETLQAEGHEVKVSDLYRQAFDPVSDRRNFTTVHNPSYFKQQLEEKDGVFSPDIETEQQKVEWCDMMIWQFPLWWFTVPGILKGWVDKVFAYGRFYGEAKCYENGVLKGKKALLSLTTGGTAEKYEKTGEHGDIDAILKPINRGMLEFVGFSVLEPQVVYAPVRMTEEEREGVLRNYGERLKGIFEEELLSVGNY